MYLECINWNFNVLHSKNECSKLTLFLFSAQLQREMELITMMIRYIPTILMFPICLPVFFLFTQTTWFYLSCQFLSHTVNIFKFDMTGTKGRGIFNSFFFRISLRQGFHLILHNGAETIMKLYLCVFLSTNVGLYRTSHPVWKSRKFSKSGLSGNRTFSFPDARH